jgi:flagellar biosynthesis protein FlhA
MAEVGARFALDGMPGKQLAIDSDMSAGAIDHAEAKTRREREQAETTFFGSLDGASKFVKGDAIAGLLITLLNLVVGLAIGTAMHGMALGEAFQSYAILTVGDGLVTQIPAVIISIASALLLARGGATGATDLALATQLGRYPPALFTVGVLMGLFALVPGLPFLPFLLGAAALLGTGLYAQTLQEKAAARDADSMAEEPAPTAAAPSIADALDLDDIHVEFAPDLVSMVLDPATGLDARISNMRTHVATTYGLILPEIRLTDDSTLPPGTYTIRIQGVVQARDVLRPDGFLALGTDSAMAALPPGENVSEPVYGAPARWISPADRENSALQGATVVSPTEVLATHLLEIVKRNFPRLMTLKALRRLLSALTDVSDPARAEANRRMIDELVPDKVPIDLLLSVLRLLLEERVSIRNLPLILETVAEARGSLGTPEAICEHVRQRLGFQLVADLRRSDGTVPLVQLAPEWEDRFRSHQVEGGADVALPPADFTRLVSGISAILTETAEIGVFPAVVTSARRRRFLSTLVAAKGLSAPVLSFEEIGLDARPAMVGQVPA